MNPYFETVGPGHLSLQAHIEICQESCNLGELTHPVADADFIDETVVVIEYYLRISDDGTGILEEFIGALDERL